MHFTPVRDDKDKSRLRAVLATCKDEDEELVCEVRDFATCNAHSKCFPPGTSWQRRLVHQVAKDMGLFTVSEGVDPDRYVRVMKTAEDGAPDPEKVLKLQARIKNAAETQGEWRVLVEDLTGHERERLKEFCLTEGLQFCRVEAKPARFFVCREPSEAQIFR